MTAVLVVVIVAVVIALGAAWLYFLRMLARRVVGAAPRRRPVEVSVVGETVILPRTIETEAPGNYGLWFGKDYTEHVVVGDVVACDAAAVTRSVVKTSPHLPIGRFNALWTGHTLSSPGDLGVPWSTVDVPLADGGTAPAWLFPSERSPAPWAIHVQGIRTSRLVTMRAVEAAHRAGFASLVITYRGAGDGPVQPASTLGLSEWSDLHDATRYARAEGAPLVVVMAWSMGAGLALELARREPAAVDGLVLICPATNWRKIVQHGAQKAHLPRFVGGAAIRFLSSRVLSRLVGLSHPIDFDRLDWTRPGSVRLPTLVVHSAGDDEIPFELSREFADAHPEYVTLVETKPAPHGWEANVDPAGFSAAIDSWLVRTEN